MTERAPKNMIAAMPDGAIAIEHKTGSTWNDGGSWHSLVARLLDGTHIIIEMQSYYWGGFLKISPHKYLSANVATEQAAEIERLREALSDMRQAVCGDTGFANAVRLDTGKAYDWPALEIAEEKANAALAVQP